MWRPRCRRRIACGRRGRARRSARSSRTPYIMECAEESLRNLGLDTIDLLQLHVWQPEFWTDADDWRRAFEELKRRAKCGAVGISDQRSTIPDSVLDADPHRPDRCRAGDLQHLRPDARNANLLPLCLEENIGVLARVPLDEGALSGTMTRADTIPAGRFPRILFPRRPQEAGGGARERPAGGSGAEPAELPDTALRFCLSTSGGVHRHTGHAHGEHAERTAALSDLRPPCRGNAASLKRHAWDRNFYN